MAVTFTIEVESKKVTRQQLDEVRRRVGLGSDESMPTGMLAHLESQKHDGGYRIVDVWETPEDFERFSSGSLGEAFEATDFHPLAGPPPVEPVLSVFLRQGQTSEEAARNEAVIRAGYEAFAHGDVPRVLDLMDEHILWYTPDTVRFGGTYAGKGGVGEFFSHLPENYAELNVEPTTFVSAREHVVVQGHHRGKSLSGTPFDVSFMHSWTMRAGKAVSFTEFFDTTRMNAVLGIPAQAQATTR